MRNNLRVPRPQQLKVRLAIDDAHLGRLVLAITLDLCTSAKSILSSPKALSANSVPGVRWKAKAFREAATSARLCSDRSNLNCRRARIALKIACMCIAAARSSSIRRRTFRTRIAACSLMAARFMPLSSFFAARERTLDCTVVAAVCAARSQRRSIRPRQIRCTFIAASASSASCSAFGAQECP